MANCLTGCAIKSTGTLDTFAVILFNLFLPVICSMCVKKNVESVLAEEIHRQVSSNSLKAISVGLIRFLFVCVRVLFQSLFLHSACENW